MKSKIIKYRHIKLEIRFPKQEADIQDNYDMNVALDQLCKEWAQLVEEVDLMFGMIKIEPKEQRLRLP